MTFNQVHFLFGRAKSRQTVGKTLADRTGDEIKAPGRHFILSEIRVSSHVANMGLGRESKQTLSQI